MSKYASNGEVITFHLPAKQGYTATISRPLSKIEDELNNRPTFRIYRTNGMGLKLAKRHLEAGLK